MHRRFVLLLSMNGMSYLFVTFCLLLAVATAVIWLKCSGFFVNAALSVTL